MLKKLTATCCPLLMTLTVAGALSATGCSNEERVLDVETPGGSVEVDRNTETGELDVDVDDNDDGLLE